ncbi:MAG: AroM family protein [Chloroflexota bacterium]|nr:AroM family protein [Chloroflexota bacterium]
MTSIRTAPRASPAAPPSSNQAEPSTWAIGVLTIGQSPRPDGLSRDIQAVLGARVRVVERGALDGLAADDVERLAPAADDYRLITLLRDGRSVQVSKRAILERLQAQIEVLEDDEGVDATLMMCTGAFPAFRHRRSLLLPQAALYGATIGMASGGRIGSLTPLATQVAQARDKWRELGVPDAEVVVANPYGDDPTGEVAAASADARDAGAQVLFMDCFGYNLTMKAAARHAFGGPVVLARSLAARLLVEMVD